MLLQPKTQQGARFRAPAHCCRRHQRNPRQTDQYSATATPLPEPTRFWRKADSWNPRWHAYSAVAQDAKCLCLGPRRIWTVPAALRYFIYMRKFEGAKGNPEQLPQMEMRSCAQHVIKRAGASGGTRDLTAALGSARRESSPRRLLRCRRVCGQTALRHLRRRHRPCCRNTWGEPGAPDLASHSKPGGDRHDQVFEAFHKWRGRC